MRLWRIQTLEEVASTNAFAKERVHSGHAHHGDVVQAWHQTAGRGRILGRLWQDKLGESLLMSVVLERAPASPECIQYLVALSAISALREIARACKVPSSLSFRLKWPNDILLGEGQGVEWIGRKVCGTLTEALWQGNRFRSAIVGIGVNVRQTSFDDVLALSATSLLLSGIDISVNEVRDRILDSLEADLDRYSAVPVRRAREQVIDSLRSELGWMLDAAPMTVSFGNSPAMLGMHFEGISDTGALLVRGSEGNLITLQTGSVESEQTMKTAEPPREFGDTA